ncbi:Calsyntenin-2 Alcadein-gamma [Takifugu flavidus]|uniref:Calsyntenin-2 Alcadein-gamma n=1 Tax=Takifugu flavidus TaxID=433684 RepID=A0A5C6PC17_9TELE|nr:Calsyntenin-2 Alcadein-gamma [Takifugu flavidus]
MGTSATPDTARAGAQGRRFLRLSSTNLLPPSVGVRTVSSGEICAFNIQGLESPFEAVVLNGTSGEGQLRARGLVDCESQKEYTFIIQAHDCGSGPGGAEGKKSHKREGRGECRSCSLPPCPPGGAKRSSRSHWNKWPLRLATVEAAGLDRKEPSQVHNDTDDLLSFMSSARQSDFRGMKVRKTSRPINGWFNAPDSSGGRLAVMENKSMKQETPSE